MSSKDCSSKAAARRESKALSASASRQDTDDHNGAPAPDAEDTLSPTLGSLSVELVNNSEHLISYKGDIRDSLINLLDHVEEDERAPADGKDKTRELIYAIFHYVESCASNNDSQSEMRETLKFVESTFDDIVTKLDKGSPYQKVINWCNLQRSKKEKQQKQRRRRERDGSS